MATESVAASPPPPPPPPPPQASTTPASTPAQTATTTTTSPEPAPASMPSSNAPIQPTDPYLDNALADAERVVTDSGRALVVSTQQLVTSSVQVASDTSRAASQHVHQRAEDAQRALATETQRRTEQIAHTLTDAERAAQAEAERIERTVLEAEQRLVSDAERRVQEAERELAAALARLAEEANRARGELATTATVARDVLADEARRTRRDVEEAALRRAHDVQSRVDAQARRALGDAYQPVADDVRAITDAVQRRLTGKMLRRDSKSPAATAAAMGDGGTTAREVHSPKPTRDALFSLGGSSLAAVTGRIGSRSGAPDTQQGGRVASGSRSPRPVDPYQRMSSVHRGSINDADLPTLPKSAGLANPRSESPRLYEDEDEDEDEKTSPTEQGEEPKKGTWLQRHGIGRRKPRLLTVEARLQPTIDYATSERDRCKIKATKTALWVNMAIGLQVFFGALTTGLSAVLSGKKAGVTTSVFGGITTMLASYLARMRGSGEPELSRARTKDLENFLRDVNAVILDKGQHVTQPALDKDGNPIPDFKDEIDIMIDTFRRRFEDIMGNGNGQRKFATPV